MTRQVSSKAEASRKKVASFDSRSARSNPAHSLENNLLTAYMGFIRESQMPLDRFLCHGGWLLEQSHISTRPSPSLARKALRIAALHPRLAAQLRVLSAFLAAPPKDAPATAIREAAFAAYFVLNAPGALLADHAAVVETALQVHSRVFKKFCRLRQLAWEPLPPRAAA